MDEINELRNMIRELRDEAKELKEDARACSRVLALYKRGEYERAAEIATKEDIDSHEYLPQVILDKLYPQ